jgi:predicted phage terminase large subunit-like protein
MTVLTDMDKVRVFDAVCRKDFSSFVRKCFHTLAPNAAYLTNWHILSIAYHLELVRQGEIKRLIINLPPRSLKSIMCSVAFPAFILGHDPSKRIIAVSYGAELATKLSNDFRAVVSADWYRRLFPGMQIAGKNTEFEVATTEHGFRLAAAIEGTLTGRGGDIMIIDDPLKPIDALSDSRRTTVTDVFFNTLLSRLDDKRSGAIVLVMQRLHMDDLAGTLLGSSNDWTLLSLPAIADREELIQIGDEECHRRMIGDVLHPEREPISVLQSTRLQQGSDIFAAQYQQAPVPPGGVMIKREWVRRYDRLPERTSSCEVIQSWDTASKDGGQNDWSVCTTWWIVEGKYYLADLQRGRWDYPTLKARAVACARGDEPDRIFIEDTGVGTALIAELKKAGLSAIGVKPDRDKQTRMSIQSAKFESGRVLIPAHAPWLADLEVELFAFPNSRHDDQVDSISQALAHELERWPYTEKFHAGLERFYRGLGSQLRPLPSHSTYEAMGIGGVAAYLLGLTG